ncbi:hypothetical protein SDC9_95409 [bioreactor metagenome]|uniref:SsuA/THI5-like domain-containing protein n=1 Tax=bioreactor metagenome TaxID=1076179 RepID=A0A645ACW6_9ZZZZ
MMKKFFALTLALLLVLGLAACGGPAAASPSPSVAPTETPAPTPTADPNVRTRVNLMVLSGPTGVGAAKLLADNDAGLTVNDYTVTVAAANDEITAKLISGEADIAALATNVASNLYHKTGGAIQIAALNTLGVLHILERGGPTVRTMAGLKGKTLYAVGQGANPEYVLNYLLTQNGLDPAKDVEIVWKTAEEVTALMLSGEAKLCMLPEPAATALVAKAKASGQADAAVSRVLDLTEEWQEVTDESVLTMGCMVVRTQFAKENPAAVNAFLTEYAASIDYVTGNVEEAAELVAQYKIAPSAAIAQQAIPGCNLVCITGEEVRDRIQGYYEVLYAANPASIGGSIPDDAFYYLP